MLMLQVAIDMRHVQEGQLYAEWPSRHLETHSCRELELHLWGDAGLPILWPICSMPRRMKDRKQKDVNVKSEGQRDGIKLV